MTPSVMLQIVSEIEAVGFASDQLAELLVGRRQRQDSAVEQRIGDAGLLLDCLRQCSVARRRRADVEYEIGLERDNVLKVGEVAAPGESADLRPRANRGQQERACFRPVAVWPAQQQIRRQRIKQNCGGRPSGKDALDACRRRYGPASIVGDRCARTTRGASSAAEVAVTRRGG